MLNFVGVNDMKHCTPNLSWLAITPRLEGTKKIVTGVFGGSGHQSLRSFTCVSHNHGNGKLD